MGMEGGGFSRVDVIGFPNVVKSGFQRHWKLGKRGSFGLSVSSFPRVAENRQSVQESRRQTKQKREGPSGRFGQRLPCKVPVPRIG